MVKTNQGIIFGHKIENILKINVSPLRKVYLFFQLMIKCKKMNLFLFDKSSR